MDLDRRLYPIAELESSAEAVAVVDRLFQTVTRAMARFAHLSESEVAAMLEEKNRNGTDFGHRFCYEEWLGGLCHIQFSYLPDEDFFTLAPWSISSLATFASWEGGCWVSRCVRLRVDQSLVRAGAAHDGCHRSPSASCLQSVE